ncbi:MAG: DUF1552 domain-containing protein [Planctomycetota bacterium]
MSRPFRLHRRTLLRGAGVACALPYLEAMAVGNTPAASASDAAKRMCFVYFPNGVSMPPAGGEDREAWGWFPIGEGRDCRFTKVLEPLEPHRDELTVFGGFSHPNSRRLLGHIAGDTWLTGGDLRGSAYKNSISADQVAARAIGGTTRYPSLTLSCDGGVGYKSRIATLSFADGGKPVPAQHNPRAIFERYFVPSGGDSLDERRRSLDVGRKVVDLIMDDARVLRRRLGRTDRVKMDDYLDSLSQVETGIARSESWLDTPLPDVDESAFSLDVSAAVDPQAYIRTMFDLITLAFETDLTRVVTYMIAREDGMGFGENFPKLALGIKKGHHKISHDKSDGHWAEWGSYDRWLTSQLAYFVDRLRNVRDARGPVLDNTLVLYGSACSSTHNARNYPLVLAGGSGMGVEHGGYRPMSEETPMSNLLLSALRTAGAKVERFADSNGLVEGLPA